jgi:transposase InsO family protein
MAQLVQRGSAYLNIGGPNPSWSVLLFKKDVKLWALQCTPCQTSKVGRHTRAKIATIPTSERFHTVHIDLVGPLPPSNGFRYLCTMVDRFTGWVEAVPLVTMDTEATARAFIEHWVGRFGVPSVLISDRGAQFESALWQIVMNILGIKRNRTTAYHPSANGAIEIVHRPLKAALRAKCSTSS